MKVLVSNENAVTVKLNSGKIVIVKEEEFLIRHGDYVDNCKVGYNDAELMSITLKMIFKPELDELTALRREVKYRKHPR
jgi:hypothetical protein